MTPLCRLSAYGLPPPGMNFSGGDDVLAVRQVHLPQAPVPRHGVDRVLPGRRLRHRRHGGLAAGAERVVRAAGFGRACCRSAGARSACPVATSMPNRSSETPATTASSRGPLRGRDALGDERRKQVVHRARRALELHLPQELHAPDVGRGEDLLVAHPARARVVDALGEEVGGPPVTPDNSRMTMTLATRMYLVPRLTCRMPDHSRRGLTRNRGPGE